MIKGEETHAPGQVSVAWQGGTPDKGDPSLERAAAFAAVLARTLAAAGYQARNLSIGASRGRPDNVLHLNVRADVPGISQPDFEALARATMNGVSARLGFSFDDDLVLVAELEQPRVSQASRPVPIEPPEAVPLVAEPEPAAATPRRDWFVLGRIALGLLLGLLLGVLGLPRLQLGLPSLPNAAPRVSPTSAPPTIISVRDLTTSELPNVISTVVPTAAVVQPVAAPTVALVQPTAVPTVAIVQPTPPATLGPSVLVAERFTSQPPNWPNDPNGTAWWGNAEYRLFARDPGHFVAVGVPLPNMLPSLQVSGQFHKIEGPAGGGYGFIVRDQGAVSERDGRNQAGQYVVLEVDDRGDIGIWQRDDDRWIDILPWTHSEAVHVDRSPNTLAVNTDGAKLRFVVNGVQVADVTYDRLPQIGGVGVFAGGDLNEVALEWLRIEGS